jgi:putative chitinase
MAQQLLISDFHCDGTWPTLYQGIRQQVVRLDLGFGWKKVLSAYALGTVKLECDNKWRPIEEYGKGRGKDYLANKGWGRGLVQLTWNGPPPHPNNYLKYQNLLGLPLTANPDLALRSDVSLFILVHGMWHGVFTGRGFSHYKNPTPADFPDMRKIINGTDRKDLIALHARNFLSVL